MTDDSFGAFRADEIGLSADTGGGVSPPVSSRTNYPAGSRVTGVSEAARATANASNARHNAVSCHPPAGAFWEDRWTTRRKWTEQRNARLKQGWEGGEDTDSIRAALNAMPGPPIPGKHALSAHARDMGWRRPAGYSAAIAKSCTLATSPWTDDRVSYLREAYPRGDMIDDILVALNAMPGKRIRSKDAVTTFAQTHGIARPRGHGVSLAAKWKAENGPWHPARRAKLAELWADLNLTAGQIAVRINEIPGPRDVTANACQRKAWEMRLPARKTGPKPSAEPKPPKPAKTPRPPKAAKPAVERKQVLGTSRTYTFGSPADAPEPDAPPPEYDAARASSVESRVERARMMLRRRGDAMEIAVACKLPLWRVFAILGEIRAERAA